MTFYALVHAADDLARSRRMKRATALDHLRATVRDLFLAR
jgi:hypothetical protein